MRGIFQMNGLEEYLAAVQKAGLDVDVVAAEAVDQGADIPLEAIREKAPVLKKEDPRRVKGQLRSEIYRTPVQRDGNYTFVEIGVDQSGEIGYELHVECGTAKMAAQPFFRPGIDENRSKVRALWRKIFKARGLAE